jgi:aspartate 1-decarboxylase
MDAAGLLENEQVHIVNNNNGERLITYVIRGERGSGIICLNGAAARRAQVGDIVIIIAYAMMTPDEARIHKPTLVFPDDHNRLVRV